MSVYLYSMSNSIIIEQYIKFLNILGEKGQSQFFLCIIISAMSNKYNDNYQLLILLNLNIFRPELAEVPPPPQSQLIVALLICLIKALDYYDTMALTVLGFFLTGLTTCVWCGRSWMRRPLTWMRWTSCFVNLPQKPPRKPTRPGPSLQPSRSDILLDRGKLVRQTARWEKKLVRHNTR